MNLKKNFFYNTVLLLSQYIIPMVTFPYISRVFGVEKLGILNWVDSTINYFILISTLGLALVGVREIAKCNNDKHNLSKVFYGLLTLHCLLTFIAIIVYLLFITYNQKFEENKILYLIGLVKLVSNVFTIEWYFKGTENFKYITIRSIIIKVLYVAAVFLFINNSEDYILYFIFTCIITVFTSVINYWFAKKNLYYNFHEIEIKKYIKPCFSLGFYLILTGMYTTFNIMYLGYVSTNEAVGYYTTALKLYTIILGLFSALNTSLMPRLSSLIEKDNLELFNKYISQSITFIITLCFPIIISGIILAPQIIFVLSGPGYENAITCFRIILPLILIVGMAQVFSNQVLISHKQDNSLVYISLSGAVVGIVLNVYVVPTLKEVGTSIVVLICESYVTVILYILAKKYARLRFPVKEVLMNLIVSIPYALICITTIKTLNQPYLILIIATFISIIYFLLAQLYIIKNSNIKLFLSKYIKTINKSHVLNYIHNK